MNNSWVSISLNQDRRRAERTLHRTWEWFAESQSLAGESLCNMRSPVAESWQRCLTQKLDPVSHPPPPVESSDVFHAYRENHPLWRMIPTAHALLDPVGEAAQHLLVVTDDKGLILYLKGSSRARAEAEEMNFTEGACWDETTAGTNAIGAALVEGHPLQIHAAEHYVERVHQWTCSAAPIRHPATGELLGAVDLTGKSRTVHPHSLSVVSTIAQLIEREAAHHAPLAPGSEPIASPVEIYALGRSNAQLRVNNRTFKLARRHSEILVLLALYPGGLSGEDLAEKLYNSCQKASVARAELARLRKQTDLSIEANPYRISGEVWADFLEVEGLLRQGAVREATDKWAGSLLPHSDTPGIEEARYVLDALIREAAMSSGDLELLWSWANTLSGKVDFEAWKELSSKLKDDSRGAYATSYVELLGNSEFDLRIFAR